MPDFRYPDDTYPFVNAYTWDLMNAVIVMEWIPVVLGLGGDGVAWQVLCTSTGYD